MNANDLQNFLEEMLSTSTVYSDEGEEYAIDRVSSFAAQGVLTNAAGLVLCIDGKEFQLTIVRSK